MVMIAMERTAPDNTLPLSLQFLKSAASLMAQRAPSSAAQLGATYNELMFANEMRLSDDQRREICGGCGGLSTRESPCLIEETVNRSESSAKEGASNKSKNLSKQAHTPFAKRLDASSVYVCQRCRRKTQLSISSTQHRSTLHRDSSTRSLSKDSASSSAVPPGLPVSSFAKPTATSASVSSKKRAKSRKGGLQALLAKKQDNQQGTGAFGLDLMDLMKS
jgi:hypothetical protein